MTVTLWLNKSMAAPEGVPEEFLAAARNMPADQLCAWYQEPAPWYSGDWKTLLSGVFDAATRPRRAAVFYGWSYAPERYYRLGVKTDELCVGSREIRERACGHVNGITSYSGETRGAVVAFRVGYGPQVNRMQDIRVQGLRQKMRAGRRFQMLPLFDNIRFTESGEFAWDRVMGFVIGESSFEGDIVSVFRNDAALSRRLESIGIRNKVVRRSYGEAGVHLTNAAVEDLGGWLQRKR